MTARVPACWSWPITDEVYDLLGRAEAESQSSVALGLRLEAVSVFTAGRCGLCGAHGPGAVEDHDHETGLVRGPLCPGCNTSEGMAPRGAPFYSEYREYNPCSILGVRDWYTGRGWESGERTDGLDTSPPTEAAMWAAARACFGGVL